MLVIFLLFSVAMPFEVQAISFNWNTWRKKAAGIGNKAANLLRRNGRRAFSFLTKSSVISYLTRLLIIDDVIIFYLTTKNREFQLNITHSIIFIIEMAILWRAIYFLDAVSSNNVAKAKQALQLGVCINRPFGRMGWVRNVVLPFLGFRHFLNVIYPLLSLFRVETDLTPLEIAVKNDNLEMVKFLVAYGGNIIKKIRSALKIAAKNDNLEMVKFLVDYGGDAIKKNGDITSALKICYCFKHTKIIQFFLNKNVVDESEYINILTYAVRNHLLDLVELLNEKKIDFNREDEWGRTPLATAVFDWNLIEFLIGKGAEIDGRDRLNRTALMAAASVKCIDVEDMDGASGEFSDSVKFLLSKNVNIDIEDDRGYTALKCAAEEKNEFNQEVEELGGVSQYEKWKVENPEEGAMVEKWEAENAKTIELLKEAHNKKISGILKNNFSNEKVFSKEEIKGFDIKNISNIIADYTSDLLLTGGS